MKLIRKQIRSLDEYSTAAILEFAGNDDYERYAIRHTQFIPLAAVCRSWRKIILEHGWLLEKLLLEMAPSTTTPAPTGVEETMEAAWELLDIGDNIWPENVPDDIPRKVIIAAWKLRCNRLMTHYPGFEILPASTRTTARYPYQIDLAVRVGVRDAEAAVSSYSAICGQVQKLTVESPNGTDACIRWLQRNLHRPHPKLRTIIISPVTTDTEHATDTEESYQQMPVTTFPRCAVLSTIYLRDVPFGSMRFAEFPALTNVILRDCTLETAADYAQFQGALSGSNIAFLDIAFLRAGNRMAA